MKIPTVEIGIMRSQWAIGGKKYLALCIDDIRYGPDAGPWEVVETFKVDAHELINAAQEVISQSECQSPSENGSEHDDSYHDPRL